MKKSLPPADIPLPKFQSDSEAAGSFETHSIANVWDQLPKARAPKLSRRLEKSIRERHEAQRA